MSKNKTKRRLKRWFWGGISVMIGLLAAAWIASHYLIKPWIKQQVATAVKNADGEPYQFTYQSVSLDMWDGDMQIYQPAINPGDTANNRSKITAKRLDIRGVNWIAGWWYKNLEVGEVIVENPRMVLYHSDLGAFSKLSLASSQKSPWSWHVQKVSIQDGEAHMFNSIGKIMGRVGGVELSFLNWSAWESLRSVKIAEWTEVRMEEAYYFLDDRRYKLALRSVWYEASPFVCVADSVTLMPQLPRRTFGRSVGHEVDRLVVRVSQLAVQPTRISRLKAGVLDFQKNRISYQEICSSAR